MVSTGGVLGALVLVSSCPGRYTARDLGLVTEREHRSGDVVGPAVFLASAESAYVTGHTLFVDGGFVAD